MFSVKIKDFEKDQAILQDDDGRLYIWPKKLLASDAKIGEIFEVEINQKNNFKPITKKTTDPDKSILAKEILNEILKIQEK
ncbi:MAG: hypothetical protein ACOYMB_03190 [Patescibacteria group bacterium]